MKEEMSKKQKLQQIKIVFDKADCEIGIVTRFERHATEEDLRHRAKTKNLMRKAFFEEIRGILYGNEGE